MNESLIIPFYSADEVVESKPTKVVFGSNHIEMYSYYKVIAEDDETGIKSETLYDNQITIPKKAIVYFEYGKHKKCDLYAFIIGFGNSMDSIAFPDRLKCKEFYVRFQNWYHANS